MGGNARVTVATNLLWGLNKRYSNPQASQAILLNHSFLAELELLTNPSTQLTMCCFYCSMAHVHPSPSDADELQKMCSVGFGKQQSHTQGMKILGYLGWDIA